MEVYVTTLCHMDFERFPFDTQKCQVILGSASNSIENLKFVSVVEYDRMQQHLMVIINVSLTSTSVASHRKELIQCIALHKH
jgi:hypothetical protein